MMDRYSRKLEEWFQCDRCHNEFPAWDAHAAPDFRPDWATGSYCSACHAELEVVISRPYIAGVVCTNYYLVGEPGSDDG